LQTVNENHQRLCPSEGWAAYLHDEVLPALAAEVTLCGEVLELGPGPGAATEWLRHRVERVVALELDPDAAEALAVRFAGTNVRVVTGDATAVDYPDDTFDAVVTCTMLHHVPTLPKQRELLGEALRVLKPGGALLGSDSLGSVDLHAFHEGDTYNPIDPAVLLTLLRALGFVKITVWVDHALRFVAHKSPGEAPSSPYDQEETDR
jgi:SAM-dependent methyltransferase